VHLVDGERREGVDGAVGVVAGRREAVAHDRALAVGFKSRRTGVVELVVRTTIVTELVSDRLDGPKTRVVHESDHGRLAIRGLARTLACGAYVGKAAYVGAHEPDVVGERVVLESGEGLAGGVGEVRQHRAEGGLRVRYLRLVAHGELSQTSRLVDSVYVVEESESVGLRGPGVVRRSGPLLIVEDRHLVGVHRALGVIGFRRFGARGRCSDFIVFGMKRLAQRGEQGRIEIGYGFTMHEYDQVVLLFRKVVFGDGSRGDPPGVSAGDDHTGQAGTGEQSERYDGADITVESAVEVVHVVRSYFAER